MPEDTSAAGAATADAVRRAEDYDRMVDWEKRLAREAPFFRALFEENGVRSVLDVGCGSGKHAIMFSEWGLEVVGADPSEAMLAQARENARRAGADVTFVSAGFGGLGVAIEGPFDALTCLGNALPHVDGIDGLHDALADFEAMLRPGGVLVLQLLNHDRLLSQRPRTMPPTFRETPEGDRVFLKVLSYPEEGGRILFDFLTLTRSREAAEEAPSPAEVADFGDPGRDAGGWALASRRSQHTALPVSLLAPELAGARFVDVRAFGDHSGKAFEPEADESVIVTATLLQDERP